MKQWKLIVVTLLAVLMVCVCTSAMADHTHKPQAWTIVEQATCAKQGKMVRNACTVEGCELNNEEVFILPVTDEHGATKGYKAKEATCSEEGYTYYEVCTVCGEIVKGKEPVAKNPDNHTAVKYAEKKWETCTEDGYEAYYYCDDCGWKGNTYKVIPAPGHSYKTVDWKVKPNCSTVGIMYERCEWCKDLIEVEKTTAPDTHNAITVPAKNNSCTEDGYNTYDKCKDCGVILSNNGVLPVTKAYGHKYQTVDWKVKPDCVTVGIMYERCAHCKDLIEVEKAKNPDGHKWSTVPAKNNSCTEEGYKSYDKCTLCGKIATADGQVPVTKPYGHAWIDSAVVKAATCTEAGVMKQRCTHCNATQEVEIKKLPHDETKETNLSYPATCTTDGKDVYVCKTCDEFLREEVLPKAEHEMRIDKIEAPDCENYGYELWICTNGCGHEEERRTVDALGHDWKTVRVEKPTCTKEGYTQQYCAQCKTYQNIDKTAKIEHKFTVKDATKDPTCENEGFTWYYCEYKCGERTKKDIKTATGHNYFLVENVEPTCQAEGVQTYKCPNAGCETKYKTVKVEKLPHAYADSKWTAVVAPTCTETGREMNICIMCEDKAPIYRDVAALGHKMGKPTAYAGKAPTCTTAGEGWIKCERCSLEENVVLNALDHTYDEEVLVAATCTTQGMKKISCARCNYVAYELIAAKGHGKMTEVSKTPATCTEAGEIVSKCEVCGEAVVEVIPATGHTNTKEEVVTAPTCTEAGSNKVVCTICGETVETKEVAALGHGATEEKAVKEATCTEAGSVEVICTVCGETLETEEVAALGHDMVAGAVTAPTCTEKGYTTYECSRCDVTEQKDETAALGHNYEWVIGAVEATPAAPGENHYKCTECGDVSDIEYVKYTKYYYENTLTSFGPTTEELLGEGDWYRVTPIDLSVDGIYTFDLIASNAYVVGTVTITVSEGVMTVSYDVNANHIEVLEEALLLYASKADLAEGKAVTVAFGEEINVAETFGEDTKVLVSVMLTGTYDAAGYGVYGFEADAAEIEELLAIVD